MSWETAEDRRRRLRDRLLTVGLLATVAWATLAFGAVYPWAYVPLLAACTLVGGVCLAADGEKRPRLVGSVTWWLGGVAAAALLQLVPLPASIIARISPATDAFLKSYQFAYAVTAADPDAAGRLWHPLSLAPASTWLAIAFLVPLTVLLAGLMRWLRPRHVPVIARTLIALGVLVAVLGIAQKALGSPELRDVRIYGFWKPQQFGNPFGPFVNRNHFAGWTLMVLPLALAYFAAKLHEATSSIEPGWRNRLLWIGSDRAGKSVTAGFAVLVMAVALVYSDSRSGLACALFVVAAVGWLVVRSAIGRKTRLGIAVVFAVIAAGAMVWAGSDLILHRFTLIPAEIGDRVGTWRDALRVVRDFPLAGVGLNAYGTASLHYQTVVSAWQYDRVHNDYLQIAAEGGLLLTVPAAMALVALVRQLRGRARHESDELLVSWLRAGALVGLGAIALQSLVEFSLQIPANALLLVVLVGIAAHQPAIQPAGGAIGGRDSRVGVAPLAPKTGARGTAARRDEARPARGDWVM